MGRAAAPQAPSRAVNPQLDHRDDGQLEPRRPPRRAAWAQRRGAARHRRAAWVGGQRGRRRRARARRARKQPSQPLTAPAGRPRGAPRAPRRREARRRRLRTGAAPSPPRGGAVDAQAPLGVSAPPLGEAWKRRRTRTRRRGGGERRGEGRRGRLFARARARACTRMRSCRRGPRAKRDAQARWSAAQRAPTPTPLPTLKFHDLVFGRAARRGNFVSRALRAPDHPRRRSSVARTGGGGGGGRGRAQRVARVRGQGHLDREDARVDRRASARSRARSRSCGFVAHPGIARMVCGARRRDGACRVLERPTARAARACTRTSSRARLARRAVEPLRRRRGALAALASVHDAGFVFATSSPRTRITAWATSS